LSEGDVQLAQSLAILEYLDERYPSPPLLPASIEDRARVRQLALTVACEIHPLNNLRVLKYLTGNLGLAEEAKVGWIEHWIKLGFEALEAELGTSKSRGRFCFGDSPTIADCCLVPQMFNAQRFNVDLSAFPMLLAIHRACDALRGFQAAHPSRQPDFE
jgi:maleylpyruvate isomerase